MLSLTHVYLLVNQLAILPLIGTSAGERECHSRDNEDNGPRPVGPLDYMVHQATSVPCNSDSSGWRPALHRTNIPQQQCCSHHTVHVGLSNLHGFF